MDALIVEARLSPSVRPGASSAEPPIPAVWPSLSVRVGAHGLSPNRHDRYNPRVFIRNGAQFRCVCAALFIACAAPAAHSTHVENIPFGQLLSFESRLHFNPAGSSARAIGMGGAFIAVADDATAASFNPAGLAQLEYPEFSTVLRQSLVSADYTGFLSHDQVPDLALTDSSYDFDQFNLDFLSVTLPFEVYDRNIAVQVSFQDLFDLHHRGARDFDELSSAGSPEYHLSQRATQDGGIHTLSVSVAAQITSRLSAGWTLNRWMGDWTLDGIYREVGVADPLYDEYVRFHQTNNMTGWNQNVGIMLRYPKLRVGFVVRTPFDADYEYNIATETSIEDARLPDGRVRSSLHWPLSFGTGVLLQPNDTVSIAFDMTRTWWSEAALTNLAEPGVRVNFFDLRDETTTRNTTQLRAGFEYLFTFGTTLLPVRLGAFTDPPPAGDTGTGDRPSFRGVTGGFGMKRGPIQLDVAAEYRRDETRMRQYVEPDDIAEGHDTPGASGNVRLTDLRLYVSAIYRLPNRTAVKDLFRHLFVGPKTK